MLTADQARVVASWQAGCRWFYNEAARSQRDRHAARARQVAECRPVTAFVESPQALSYAVSVAKKAGITYWHDDAEHPLSAIPSKMLIGTLGELGAAWERHFRARKDGRKSSPPGFRARRGGLSLRWQCQVRSAPAAVSDLLTQRAGKRSRMRLPDCKALGEITVNYHRDLPADARVRFLVLKTDSAGRHWLYVQYETASAEQPAAAGVTGLDRGVAVTVALDDGRWFTTPDLTPGRVARELRLRRSLSRKRRLNPCSRDVWVTGKDGRPRLDRRRSWCADDGGCGCWKHSRRYQRAVRGVQLYGLLRSQAQDDAEHKASRVLAREFAVVVMEDLDVSAMTASARGTEGEPGRNVAAKAGLNREIARSRWHALEHKASYKTTVVKVPARHTSQACPACGLVSAGNRPSRDQFRCTECGYSGHADVVAAINIRNRYLASEEATAPARGVEARETRDHVGGRPANAQLVQSSCERSGGDPVIGERSHAGQEACPVVMLGVALIPARWGAGTARVVSHRRRSQRARSPSGRKAGPDG